MDNKQQNKNNLFDKKINICFLLFNSLFVLIAFIICISLSVVYKNYCILYGCLINIPFIYLCLFFGYISNRWIFNGNHKSRITIIAIFLYSIRYIILLLGMIIGLIINASTKVDVFNIYALFSCALIYPIASVLSIVVYNYINNKKQTKTENLQ